MHSTRNILLLINQHQRRLHRNNKERIMFDLFSTPSLIQVLQIRMSGIGTKKTSVFSRSLATLKCRMLVDQCFHVFR